MTSKFDLIKNKVAQVTMSIDFLHSSHNHTTILLLFKTYCYYYYFISLHNSVFCVFLFVCLLFSANRSNRKSCISACRSVVPQLIDFS